MTNRRFQRVGVILGGPSSEREVSLNSGRAVAHALRERGYEVDEIDPADRSLSIPDGVEAVFVALHGEFGEDGVIQSMLRDRGIPYTGSTPEASRRAFDKTLSKRILVEAGIPTPPYEVLEAPGPHTLPLPLVVKPARQGSSIGVHIVTDEGQWAASLADALSFGGEAIVEEFIPGHELTVGIVDEEALPVLEIRAPRGFYNYQAKYTKGLTEYLVPAPIPDECARLCREWALATHRAHRAAGMSRVDFRMTEDGRLYTIELNSIPGFTATSLLPKAARAAGIDFPELCERILILAQVH